MVKHLHWVMIDQASKIESEEAKVRARQWREWASTGAFENGARGGHRFAKEPAPWAAAC